MYEATFAATITKEENSGWTCVIWPESIAFFGTGKAVRVVGTVDGYAFQTSMLPTGHKAHMLPLKAAILKAIGKGKGDTVDVRLSRRTDDVLP